MFKGKKKKVESQKGVSNKTVKNEHTHFLKKANRNSGIEKM